MVWELPESGITCLLRETAWPHIPQKEETELRLPGVFDFLLSYINETFDFLVANELGAFMHFPQTMTMGEGLF